MIAYHREVLVEVLVYHQRSDIMGCCCGCGLCLAHSENTASPKEAT